jgi:hypothetical protein
MLNLLETSGPDDCRRATLLSRREELWAPSERLYSMPSATSRRTVRRSRSTVQVGSVVRFRTRTTSPQGCAGRIRRTIGSHASNWARMLSR